MWYVLPSMIVYLNHILFKMYCNNATIEDIILVYFDKNKIELKSSVWF